MVDGLDEQALVELAGDDGGAAVAAGEPATKDADIDVINFYTQEFQKRGWVVQNSQLDPGDFALAIDYDDGKATKEIQGTIRAEAYSEDASLTEVNLIVQVSASRGRGN